MFEKPLKRVLGTRIVAHFTVSGLDSNVMDLDIQIDTITPNHAT